MESKELSRGEVLLGLLVLGLTGHQGFELGMV